MSRLGFVLGAPCARVLFSLLETSFLLRRRGSSLLSRFTGFIFSIDPSLFFFLTFFLFSFRRLFFFSFRALFGMLFRCNAFFFLNALAVQLVLFLLCLLLENVALDVGALAADLNVYRSRATLCTDSRNSDNDLRFSVIRLGAASPACGASCP
jgi:hypothetical protein